jgi:hypothetical protein
MPVTDHEVAFSLGISAFIVLFFWACVRMFIAQIRMIQAMKRPHPPVESIDTASIMPKLQELRANYVSAAQDRSFETEQKETRIRESRDKIRQLAFFSDVEGETETPREYAP